MGAGLHIMKKNACPPMVVVTTWTYNFYLKLTRLLFRLRRGGTSISPTGNGSPTWAALWACAAKRQERRLYIYIACAMLWCISLSDNIWKLLFLLSSPTVYRFPPSLLFAPFCHCYLYCIKPEEEETARGCLFYVPEHSIMQLTVLARFLISSGREGE